MSISPESCKRLMTTHTLCRSESGTRDVCVCVCVCLEETRGLMLMENTNAEAASYLNESNEGPAHIYPPAEQHHYECVCVCVHV